MNGHDVSNVASSPTLPDTKGTSVTRQLTLLLGLVAATAADVCFTTTVVVVPNSGFIVA